MENGDAVSLSRAKGKIVMVNGRVSGDVYQRLVSAGAVGFVSVEGSPLDEGVDRVPCQRSLPMIFPGNAEGEIEGLSESSEDIHEMQEKYSGRIPGANLHYKDAVELVTEGAAVVCLAVEQEVTACTSRNVVARIEGTDKKDEILTLTAHYDSVPEGPGPMIIWPERRSSWSFADIFSSTDRAGLWSLCGLVLRRRACWAAGIISEFMRVSLERIVLI